MESIKGRLETNGQICTLGLNNPQILQFLFSIFFIYSYKTCFWWLEK